MRALVVVAVISFVRIASAEPERRCYAGTQTMDPDSKNAVVVVRVVDRASKTIQETTWSDRDPYRTNTRTMMVDPDHGTFTAEIKHLHAHETGTLDGKPWRWTGAHSKIDAGEGGLELQSDTQLTADKLVVTSIGRQHGKVALTSRLEANLFDCKQLDAKRGALDHTSASAVHTCYEGASTAIGGVGAGTRHVVIDQVVDAKAKTIELRRWTQGSETLRRDVLAIDGVKIAVTRGGLVGAGSIGGKPGAWTDYTWTTPVQMLELTIHGTLGGPKLTESSVTRNHGKETSHTDLAASTFDCAKLDERRAAVAALEPLPIATP